MLLNYALRTLPIYPPMNEWKYIKLAMNPMIITKSKKMYLKLSNSYEVRKLKRFYHKNGKIKFLDCLFFGEKLRLDFEKYNTIHSNIPTLETKRLDKNWKAFLTICEREKLNPLDMIQPQIDWLNDLPVYNSILREGASDLAAVSLYFDRSQKTRYIKQKDSYNHNRTFEVWQSSTYKAVQRKRHGNWF